MNYGKYFRLNLWESKIVNGVAVYDYIDLPAYFDCSSDNLISPKYPITAVISKDAVRFRLHYCTFRQEGLENDENGNAVKNVKYFYSAGSAHQLVHMQEVILELPFSGGGNESLAEIISKVYFTRFPLLTEFDAQIKNDGYVNQILSKRYSPDLWAFSEEDVFEKESYLALQKNIDGDRSFSSIWLMDLQTERQINGRATKVVNLCLDNSQSQDDSSKDKTKYVGFLRKLLLDFMFDLVHSDIFQSSPHYNKMLTGFESDKLFSALLHKCEYYYYRGLTLDALESIEMSPKEEQAEKKKQVRMLYATQLLNAEKKWVEDIMSPSSDEFFKEPQDDFSDEWKNQKEKKASQSVFRIYPYWFASPEEEMRRVCFLMSSSRFSLKTLFSRKSKDSLKVHLCNSETLAHYLMDANDAHKEHLWSRITNLFRGDKSAIGQLRTKISKWFFKRYDFDDAFRLHLFEGFAVAEFVILFLSIVLFIAFPSVVEQYFWTDKQGVGFVVAIVLGLSLILLTLISAAYAFRRPTGKETRNILWTHRITLAWKRVFWLLLFIIICISLIFMGASSLPRVLKIIGTLLGFCFFLVFSKKTNVISNIHILYPRLFAAITAAWLTLAIGNELFSAFFDSSPSLLACFFLGAIVFVFLLYEINRHYPLLSSRAKLWRSAQMLVYSYAISLVVGLFIINFTGREFLERSDYLPKYFKEYVRDSTVAQVPLKSEGVSQRDSSYLGERMTVDSSLLKVATVVTSHDDTTTHTRSSSLVDGSERHHKRHPYVYGKHPIWRRPHGIVDPPPGSNRYLVEELETRQVPGKEHNIASVWRFGDKPLFFILRDFLIQFAFLAMFIGVFIQMVFEEKSITEM